MNQRSAAQRCRLVLLLAVVASACHPTRGCVASSFDLSQDSRLPVWFSLPAGLTRADVTVHMDYWSGPNTRTATVTLKRVSGGTIDSVVATKRGSAPITLPAASADAPADYPMYEVLTARGVSDIVEHRRMEPLFFMTDEPTVKQHLGVR